MKLQGTVQLGCVFVAEYRCELACCVVSMSQTELVQVSFVGATEEQARETAKKKGYGDKVAVVKTSFKANTKVCMCSPRLLLPKIAACFCNVQRP